MRCVHCRGGAFMRFNPPPNWPQPPKGWVPPHGWEPDPSWPQPPWGWPPWVDDDEVLISPGHAVARPVASLPWYRRTLTVVLLLIFFFPVGLVLLWMRPDWSAGRRAGITALVTALVLIIASNQGPPPATTTQLGPPTGAGVGSASASASASVSPSARASSPSASASPSRAAGRVKSAPVRTSAPAVVAPAVPVAPATTTQAAPPPPAPTTQAPPPPPPPAPSTTTAAPPPPSTCGAPSNPYGYNFCGVGGYVTSPPSDICDYFSCIGNFWNGRGYMVECNDGTYSMSGGISGACSYHGREDRPVYSG